MRKPYRKVLCRSMFQGAFATNEDHKSYTLLCSCRTCDVGAIGAMVEHFPIRDRQDRLLPNRDMACESSRGSRWNDLTIGRLLDLSTHLLPYDSAASAHQKAPLTGTVGGRVRC